MFSFSFHYLLQFKNHQIILSYALITLIVINDYLFNVRIDFRYIIVHCHRDILSLLQEWPFVHFEQYLYCTHCMLRREEEPYMYPAEILQHCCPQRVYRLQCCPKEPEAYIPACLVYPLDTGKLNSMFTAGLQTTVLSKGT